MWNTGKIQTKNILRTRRAFHGQKVIVKMPLLVFQFLNSLLLRELESFQFFSRQIPASQTLKVCFGFWSYLSTNMEVFTRQQLFNLARKAGGKPKDLSAWTDVVKSVLYQESQRRFVSRNGKEFLDEDSFLSSSEVDAFIVYFCQHSHDYWIEPQTNSDKSKCFRRHPVFFLEEITFPALQAALEAPVQVLDGGDFNRDEEERSRSSVYRDADQIIDSFTQEAIFKATHKTLKALGMVDAAFVFSKLVEDPVDSGSKFRRSLSVDFDTLKPKIPRLSAGELILNNGLTVSTYKVPLSSCFKH